MIFICLSHLSAEEKNMPIPQDESVASRLKNIGLMRETLKKYDYEGYDIIIVSSTSTEEANFQQQVLEHAFSGVFKRDGKPPVILSVVDSTESGQLIGSVYTWVKAEEMLHRKHPGLMPENGNLLDYVRLNNLKVAAFHNGGKGERCSPLTQSLGNSRGALKLVGTVTNALQKEIELDVLLGVVLQCSSFAATNQGTHIDTFWTSQIAFGSHPHDELVRSNFGIDKFLVGFDKNDLIPQNIADFGTAALSKKGRLTAFYGNKRFAARKGSEYAVDVQKIENELLSKGEKVAYDFGSFSTSFDMWQLIIDYWKRKVCFEQLNPETKLKRDIDPHFIQPCIRFLYGMNDLADRSLIDSKLPSPDTLATAKQLKNASEEFDRILREEMPAAHAYIWEDVNHEKDPKKKVEAAACMHEVVEFYLLYRQSAPFADFEKVFGFIDLGDYTQWFRYRRPIDILNDKFELLTDLTGKKLEIELDGSLVESDAGPQLQQRSREARLMRGIRDHEISKFNVEGKAVALSLAEVQAGKTVEGVYIKNSIVQNSDLTKGSSIINSVVNQTSGKVIANHAYLESATAPLIEADESVVHQVIDLTRIKADSEVVSDVFKTKLHPFYHGRMRAPIAYDPKGMPIYKSIGKTENGSIIYGEALDEAIGYFVQRIPYELRNAKEYSDKTARTDDGRYTFDEIREIEPLRNADDNFRSSIKAKAEKAVAESRL